MIIVMGLLDLQYGYIAMNTNTIEVSLVVSTSTSTRPFLEYEYKLFH